MYVVRKAYKEDFEKVYPLFKYFNNDKISKTQWERIFTPMCKELNNDFFGFVLESEDNKEIVGFRGLILSLREINGKKIKICSTTSWVVKPELQKKGYGSKLLEATTELEGYHFQTLTPMKEKIPLLVNYGFKIYTSKQKIIIPFPRLFIFRKSIKILINNSEIKTYLNEVDRRIYDDHQFANCNHILINNKAGYSYFILKTTNFSSRILNSSKVWFFIIKVYYKLFKKNIIGPKIKLGMIHYVSNPDFFSDNIKLWLLKICKIFNVKGLSVNEKYIKKKSFNIFNNDISTFGVYKSDTLSSKDFDTLYSEFILFDFDL